MNRGSLSQGRLSNMEYTDGEIYPLVIGSDIWNALVGEIWMNCGPDTQTHFLSLLHSPHYFSGTVLSMVRQQIELTIISFAEDGISAGRSHVICVTLPRFSRFTSPS